MSIIYDEIKRGEKGSREKFAAIDRWLRASGCDAAILGCTELSVYRTYHGLPDYYLDAMEIWRKGVSPPAATGPADGVVGGAGGEEPRPCLYAPRKRPMPTSARAFGLPKND